MTMAALPTPAQRARPPRLVARVCLNGHLLDGGVDPASARALPTARADPLSVRTGRPCSTCGSGSIVGCPCCGYPIPAPATGRAADVPHFCVVCGEYYPWTFLGEFYATLGEILDDSRRLDDRTRRGAAHNLERARQGLASRAEIATLAATFRSMGGSDWDLAAQILAVVLPPAVRSGLDLRAGLNAAGSGGRG